MKRCKAKTEVYSRVVGYFRPVQQWNPGKVAEFKDRIPFKFPGAARVARGAAVVFDDDENPVVVFVRDFREYALLTRVGVLQHLYDYANEKVAYSAACYKYDGHIPNKGEEK